MRQVFAIWRPDGSFADSEALAEPGLVVLD